MTTTERLEAAIADAQRLRIELLAHKAHVAALRRAYARALVELEAAKTAAMQEGA